MAALPDARPALPPLHGAPLALLTVAIGFATFMEVLDITIVNVSVPHIAGSLGVSPQEGTWAISSYSLASAIMQPLSGWIGRQFGEVRAFCMSVFLFVLMSMFCGMATSMPMLVVGRLLQGAGSGPMVALSLSLLLNNYPNEKKGLALALWAMTVVVAPIFGPILGGWLIGIASWHWIFLINVPVGALALLYAALALPKDHVEPSETFDFLGMLLLSPGLAAFLYGISSIPAAGTVWAGKVLIPAAAGLALIVAFVPWALSSRNRHPLIELRLFRNRNLTVAVITMSFFAMAFFGASLLFPLYFQQVRGETALAAGLLLAPQGLGAMLTMPPAGMLADRIGPGKVVLAGITTIIIGMGMFTQVGAGTSYLYTSAGLFVMGLGMGATMMPVMAAALATLTDHNIARGSTLMNIVQQVAASTGTAVFSMLLTNQVKNLVPGDLAGLGSGYAAVFTVATILVACCLVPALLLPRRKAEAPTDPALAMGH